jgi:hypothetical protein
VFVPAARPRSEFESVRQLIASGLTSRQVATRTGIPYETVRSWRRRDTPPRRPSFTDIPTPLESWRPQDLKAYAYLLGVYLGDGCIIDPPRGHPRLVLTLDAKYAGIVSEAERAIARTVPGVNVYRDKRPGCVGVIASHPIWPIAFPQHGPGRKHKRRIELVEWQRNLTHRHPEALIRGLIHSDGSRCVNSFKVALPTDRIESYAYVRYFFTNYSADIRRIFCEHCDLLGIRWTQSSFKNISIAHRDSVALLDSFVGPKM